MVKIPNLYLQYISVFEIFSHSEGYEEALEGLCFLYYDRTGIQYFSTKYYSIMYLYFCPLEPLLIITIVFGNIKQTYF